MLRTRELTANILRGVTRKSLLTVIEESNLKFEERPFTVDDVKAAREAFITGAGALVLPVVSIDGTKIGDGKAGETALWLRREYIARARASAI